MITLFVLTALISAIFLAFKVMLTVVKVFWKLSFGFIEAGLVIAVIFIILCII